MLHAHAHAQGGNGDEELKALFATILRPDCKTDAQQRDIKTVLMQKTNQAYAANDLLALLELQLQIRTSAIRASTTGSRPGAPPSTHASWDQLLGQNLRQLRWLTQ